MFKGELSLYDLSELVGILESNISESIKSNIPYDWDEDFITKRLLQDLRNGLKRIKLRGTDYRQTINWQIYKLKGTHETNFGDISLVVKKHYRDGTHLDGVAFLEAKRREVKGIKFDAMKKSQLEKILGNAPHAQYLLYDYEDITNFQHNSQLYRSARNYRNQRDMGLLLTPKTNAVCVSLNIAKETGYQNTQLYRHSIPLSVMLTSRYFQGLDLEFDDDSKQVATGFLDKFGLPKFIFEISINESNDDEEQQDSSLRINNEIYLPLE